VTGGNVTTAGKTFQLIAPPANVGNNNQQNNSTLYAFDEKQSILLISDLTVNVSPGGGSAIIPAGTWVSSHYVFYDPSSSLAIIDGTVDFSGEVLGIMTDLNELNASDFLGSDTTSYNSPSLRGLEAVDSASVSGTNQIVVHLEAGSPGDYVRVITRLIGDLDGDGFVGIADLNIVLGNWNQNVPPGDPLADPSGDGFVGIADLNVVLGNWNAGTPPSVEASSTVPEPGALSIVTVGSLMLLRRHIL
jgi:hypothetical protein